MRYISLDTITEEHLRGRWEVHSRVVNGESLENMFADVRIIEIKPAEYRSINGKERTGKWTVIREKEIIYNPQLHFYIDGRQVADAIITRLRAEATTTGEVFKLTLYFSTGLELILHKNTE